MKTMVLVLLFLFFAVPAASALPPGAIGHIHKLKGTASITRGKLAVVAATGVAVYRGDLVRTSKDGAVGIVLADDTTLSLGPNSELHIKEYVFNPKEGKFAFLARMAKGTFAYLSGLIGKLAPDSIKLEVPDATIAVRGTKLLVAVQE